VRSFTVLILHHKLLGEMKSMRKRWEGRISGAGEMRNTYKILLRKSEGKRPPGYFIVDAKII
jgi:hypothetical protein